MNKFAYQTELRAIKQFISKSARGLEIGVGTGRFAAPLGIKIGVEQAKAMAGIANKRGIKVIVAEAENLPFRSSSFDLVLIINTICFLNDPLKALKEANRILGPRGHIIIGMIDKESFLGKLYLQKKNASNFYKYANFYSVMEILDWLKKLEFNKIRICQTIFKEPKEILAIEDIKEGYGEGGFVVISAQKRKSS